jgi:hypothetical protein
VADEDYRYARELLVIPLLVRWPSSYQSGPSFLSDEMR